MNYIINNMNTYDKSWKPLFDKFNIYIYWLN